MPKSKHRKNRKPPPSQRIKQKEQEAAKKPPSPLWYTVVLFGLMGIGVVLVLLNYIVPDTFGRWGLYAGLAAIAVGFLMLTNYR